jgi:hypothetical protein
MNVRQYLQQLPPYQKVFKPITEDPQLTSPQISWASKYFSLRVLTGVECNAIGFFVLGVQSICVAHEITPDDVLDIMTELAEKTDYLYFDPKSHTVLIRNYLKWNPPSSPRAVKNMLKDLTLIRKRRGALYPQMLLTLEGYLKSLTQPSINWSPKWWLNTYRKKRIRGRVLQISHKHSTKICIR